jgi:hypothetical protein
LGDGSHGATIRPFEAARCDLLGNYANPSTVTSSGICRPAGCIIAGAFELPDVVARDVEFQRGCGFGMTVAVMLTGLLRLRNFEFHLG